MSRLGPLFEKRLWWLIRWAALPFLILGMAIFAPKGLIIGIALVVLDTLIMDPWREDEAE